MEDCACARLNRPLKALFCICTPLAKLRKSWLKKWSAIWNPVATPAHFLTCSTLYRNISNSYTIYAITSHGFVTHNFPSSVDEQRRNINHERHIVHLFGLFADLSMHYFRAQCEWGSCSWQFALNLRCGTITSLINEWFLKRKLSAFVIKYASSHKNRRAHLLDRKGRNLQ